MKGRITLERLDQIATVSGRLLKLREELKRYNTEEYLHETEKKTPWIKVIIDNHPTYLREFTVDMRDDKLRENIVKLAMQQTKMTIKKLEKELNSLLKESN